MERGKQMKCPECGSENVSHYEDILICNEDDCGRVKRIWMAPRYDDVYFEGVAWLDTL